MNILKVFFSISYLIIFNFEIKSQNFQVFIATEETNQTERIFVLDSTILKITHTSSDNINLNGPLPLTQDSFCISFSKFQIDQDSIKKIKSLCANIIFSHNKHFSFNDTYSTHGRVYKPNSIDIRNSVFDYGNSVYNIPKSKFEVKNMLNVLENILINGKKVKRNESKTVEIYSGFRAFDLIDTSQFDAIHVLVNNQSFYITNEIAIKYLKEKFLKLKYFSDTEYKCINTVDFSMGQEEPFSTIYNRITFIKNGEISEKYFFNDNVYFKNLVSIWESDENIKQLLFSLKTNHD